jgi:hypothetical protein
LIRKLYGITGDSYIAGESICGQIFDRLNWAIENGEFGALKYGKGFSFGVNGFFKQKLSAIEEKERRFG